ncbi:hypothetical protein ACH3XW_18255 [Acanthocheilonema viteae]
MDKQKNITVNIEYNVLSSKNNGSKVGKKKDKLVIRAAYEYDFHNLTMNDTVEGLHMLADHRIHITSSEKISIIAYVFDTKSAAVDYFLVHPVGMGGDYYAFSLPGRGTMTLYFLPFGATNETIAQSHGVHNVSITVRQNNKLETVKQTMKAGSLWQYTAPVEQTISIWIRDQLNNPNITKRRSKVRTISNVEIARLIVIASVRSIPMSEDNTTNFGCFMPTPIIVDRCAKLTDPVYYPTSEEFANNLLLTAPSHLCPQDEIDIRSSMKEDPKSLLVKWDEAAERISLKDEFLKKTFAIISGTTIMNIVHYGGNNGSFLHEIPAYSQWVNGDSSVVVPKDSKATLYVLADDYGREATMEGFEYPYFETVEDVSTDFSLYLYTRSLNPGVYRVGIDQELGGRYIAILISEMNRHSIGYVAAINLHRISPPIFLKYSTTVDLTTTELTTTPLMVSTMTTVTTTQAASLSVLANSLLAIYVCFLAYDESEQ